MAILNLFFCRLMNLAIFCLICTPTYDSMRLGPPNLKGIGKSVRQSNPIFDKHSPLDNTINSNPLRWIAPLQDASYLRPLKKNGLIPVSFKDHRISFVGGNDMDCTLLDGLDNSARVEFDSSGGAFISFKFPSSLSQHDAMMGKISPAAKLLAHSRIKRWWMAPNFLDNIDDVPVETQLILLELPLTAPSDLTTNQNQNQRSANSNKQKDDIQSDRNKLSYATEGEVLSDIKAKLFSDKSFSQKKYAIIAPLIDFDCGFRTTFFGGKEGGSPAGKGILAARIESGDPDVCTSNVDNAVYVAAGNDPYELLEIAYESISKKMGTFRTRKQKLRPPGLDSFGFCTWDAFYSSVDSDKVSAGLDSLSNAGVTVKYVILDDGWQSTALSGKGRDEIERSGKKGQEKMGEAQKNNLLSVKIDNLESVPGSALLQSDLLLLDAKGILRNSISPDIAFTSTSLSGEPVGEDGELSGAQIDGNLAAQKMLEKESSPIIAFLTQAVSGFYTKYVEQGAPDSWPVKLWAGLSQNSILKEKLIEFFDSQTDFSKRLTSWKANSKFENPAKGKTLKGFVKNLKESKGIDYVFVWHALSGYWGGVSTDMRDDMTSALSARMPPTPYALEMGRTSMLNKAAPFLSTNEKDLEGRNNFDIAAGAIVGGSIKKIDNKSVTFTAQKDAKKTSNTWFAKIRKLRSNIVSIIRPSKMQKSLEDGIFKGGLLQLSQRILALTNSSETGLAVKRSYSRPTPHLLLVEPALAWDPSALVGVGSVAVNKLEEMYKRMHTYLAEAGIDGVKVDAQSGIGAFGVGNGGGSTIAQACVRAVENSAKSAFSSQRAVTVKDALFNLQLQQKVGTLGSIVRRARGILGLSAQKRVEELDQGGILDSPLALTGCMCHSTENLFNYYETSMARASDDFYPKDMAAQTVHLVSCAYNTVMLGEIATTDWDMFHSKHPFAGMHAAARAISGGPVYVSDSPGNHDPKLLRRLVLPDGGILRAQIPARPTVDCLFSDVQKDGVSAMKLWSMNKVGAVAGIFNVQGSAWDRKQRRYVQYMPSMILPVLTTELRARDIGGTFSNLLGSDDTKLPRKQNSVENEKNLGMLEMFAVWSSKEKKMSILNSRNDVMRFEVHPKGWDVVSMSRILLVSGTGTKPKKIRPLVQLKGTVGRFFKNGSGSVKGEKTASVSGSDYYILSDNQYLDTVSENSNSNGKDTMNDIDDSSSNAIYWSPIGLLDMLNTGGAVEQILPTKSAKSAVFLAKGPGRFGIYASQIPKRVTVDGAECSFSFETLPEEKAKTNILLGDESRSSDTIGLNINAEVMIKEFIVKVGDISDDVQSFLSDTSAEYVDILFSKTKVDKIDEKKFTEGLIKINLMGDDSSALPLKVNPLSGVQKVAIYW